MPPDLITFVVHGARAERPDIRHLVGWVREKGHRVEVLVTRASGDATDLAAAAVRGGAGTVVAAGGDGTANEVANALVGGQVALGIIPVGTANDLARQLGIPLDADHAMDVILRRKAVPIDVGALGARVFLNVSAGGVGAEATAETRREVKESLGAVAYAVTGVRKLATLAPRRMRFSAGVWQWEGDVLAFAVGNGQCAGGGTRITPRASLTDGSLDLCIIEAMPRRAFARLALRVRRGEHLDEPKVQYRAVTAVTVESDAPIAVNVDGEAGSARHLEYTLRRSALLVHAVVTP